jgi:hypothetical protein
MVSPEFTALDVDFFARGDEEDGVVAGSDDWDSQPTLLRGRR